jgi:hypothetical protein
MTRKKERVIFHIPFTGEHLQKGKEIQKHLSRLFKREKGIGKTSPISEWGRGAYIEKFLREMHACMHAT